MSKLSLDDLRQKLRAAGLRATGPRIAVLRILESATSPLSHNDVADRLSNDSWDRATLYRNLLDIVRVGLARRSDLGDHVWRFEAARPLHNLSDHPHFVCTDCGVVECLPIESVAVRNVRAAPASLRGKEVEVQVRGRCDRCQPPARVRK